MNEPIKCDINQEPMINDNIVKINLVTNQLLSKKKYIKVLEVGCGSATHLSFEQNALITGIDISDKQLQRNNNLNERILGDIQTYRLPLNKYDVVICWDVMEHLNKPRIALKNILHAIDADGIVILNMPNVFSIKGMITKLTPHWFHVFAYRFILGKKNAGSNDIGPFPTFMKLFISPNSLKFFAISNNLTIEYFNRYEATSYINCFKKNIYINCFYNLLTKLVVLISFGKASGTFSEYSIIFKKHHRT